MKAHATLNTDKKRLVTHPTINNMIEKDSEIFTLINKEKKRQQEGIELIASYNTAESFLKELKLLDIHVAILDIGMPGMGGIEATRALKKDCPETAVLILSAYDDEPYLLALLDAGAAGFLLKNIQFILNKGIIISI